MCVKLQISNKMYLFFLKIFIKHQLFYLKCIKYEMRIALSQLLSLQHTLTQFKCPAPQFGMNESRAKGFPKLDLPFDFIFSARETGFLSLLKLERIPREMRVIPYARSRTKPNEKKVCSSKIRRQSNAGISHPKVSHKSFKRLTVPRNIAEGGPLERS